MTADNFLHRTNNPPAARLLVVDDEQCVRSLLERFLTKEGFQVTTTGEGQEALRLHKSSKPDVILLDICMPGMGGMDVLKAIRAVDPNVVVVMLTGVSDVDSIKQAIALGANDYLFKPLDLPDVRSYLGSYLKDRTRQPNPFSSAA